MRAITGPALVALVLAACASSPERSAKAPEDRTRDPDFEAARRAARPEFESQAEALAAGVYELFVHPDSIVPSASPGTAVAGRDALTTPRDRGDPSTEELLGTLAAEIRYIGGEAGAGSGAETPPGAEAFPSPTGSWTLQTGAFASETGALVRLRELERRFPDLRAWHARGEDGLVRLFVGVFANRSEAEKAHRRLAGAGYSDAWVTRLP